MSRTDAHRPWHVWQPPSWQTGCSCSQCRGPVREWRRRQRHKAVTLVRDAKRAVPEDRELTDIPAKFPAE
jgi:hypothetical protein